MTEARYILLYHPASLHEAAPAPAHPSSTTCFMTRRVVSAWPTSLCPCEESQIDSRQKTWRPRLVIQSGVSLTPHIDSRWKTRGDRPSSCLSRSSGLENVRSVACAPNAREETLSSGAPWRRRSKSVREWVGTMLRSSSAWASMTGHSTFCAPQTHIMRCEPSSTRIGGGITLTWMTLSESNCVCKWLVR